MGRRGVQFARGALLLLASALLPHIATAQISIYEHPLRVEDPTTIEVLIEYLGEHAATIGLTEDRIRDRIEIILLRNGLNYAEPTPESGDTPYLYVNLNILPNTAFVALKFTRIAFIEVDDQQHAVFASVWNFGTLNFLGQPEPSDADFLLDTLDISLDAFLADFLRDNHYPSRFAPYRPPLARAREGRPHAPANATAQAPATNPRQPSRGGPPTASGILAMLYTCAYAHVCFTLSVASSRPHSYWPPSSYCRRAPLKRPSSVSQCASATPLPSRCSSNA